MKNNISYGEVMEVYSRPISIRYIPRIFVCIFILTIAFISKPVLAQTTPALWIQVPQWSDDWSKCAVDVPDAACTGTLWLQIIPLVRIFMGRCTLVRCKWFKRCI